MLLSLRSAALSLATVASLSGCIQGAPSVEPTLAGTVSYREALRIPATAELEVKLVDVSRADAPSVTISEVKIQPQGSRAVPFALSYDPALVTSKHSYALQARVTDKGKLLAITTEHNPAINGVTGPYHLILDKVGN